MDPLSAVHLAATGLDLLDKAKKLFYSSKTIDEAKAMSAKGGEHAESLQEQVQLNQQIIDKLIQQAEENKIVLEKHNDILIGIEQELLRLNHALKTSRTINFVVIIIALIALGVALIRFT